MRAIKLSEVYLVLTFCLGLMLHAADTNPPVVLSAASFDGQTIGIWFSEALNPASAVSAVRDLSRRAGRVFVDIDCDVFDPAFFPATAHPLPFGLSPAVLLRLIDAAWGANVCGVAVSEFDPGRDRGDQSLSTLIWLVEYLLLKKYERG